MFIIEFNSKNFSNINSSRQVLTINIGFLFCPLVGLIRSKSKIMIRITCNYRAQREVAILHKTANGYRQCKV